MGIYYYVAALLPFMVCLLWTALMALDIRKADRPRRILLAFAVACTVLYACHYVHFAGGCTPGPSLHTVIWWFCNLIVYPLFWLYLCSLTDEDFRLQPKLWVFLPALCTVLAAPVLFRNPSGWHALSLVTRIVFAVQVLAVCISGMQRLVRYEHRIREFYADGETYSLQPMQVFLYLFMATGICSAAANFIGRDLFFGSMLLWLPALTFSVLLFLLFRVGYRMPFSPADLQRDRDAEPRPSRVDDTPLPRLMARIEEVMCREELYRRPGLKISDVARSVGSNRTYISNAINQVRGLSFADYVNRMRVAEACVLMDSGNVSVADAARSCGYTDRTSFYRSFKKIMGVSPSDYLSRKK